MENRTYCEKWGRSLKKYSNTGSWIVFKIPIQRYRTNLTVNFSILFFNQAVLYNKAGRYWEAVNKLQSAFELGKQLASKVLNEINENKISKHDKSTTSLLKKYLSN